jgi:Transposase DDE domain group 1
MPQGVLPYKYEEEKNESGLTALAGLPVYLDLASVIGLSDHIQTHMHIRPTQGWTDEQMILSLILLNLAGGDHVDDIRILERDEGFSRILQRCELKGLARKERRAIERKWRKEHHRVAPSPPAIFRYLEEFHNPGEEKKREAGKAFIPAPNTHLVDLMEVNKDLVASIQSRTPKKEATLDMDATVDGTTKRNALFSYKGYKAYQPMDTYWAEQGLVLHTEFRDGNVPAGYEQLRVLKEALGMLPPGVEKLYLRSDTAGYQHDLLKFCATREKRIEFSIGCDVTQDFKRAVHEVEETDWNPLMKKVKDKMVPTDTQWAEVCFVPSAIAHSKKDPLYRYLATRCPLKQAVLPGMEGQLPFQTMEKNTVRYKIFGIVTNRDIPGNELINWHYERCGKSEEAHSIMKEDLAGGYLPSSLFGANAAWWWITVLAFNLNSAMKRLILDNSWASKRMKALRFSLINLPGRIMEHAREMVIRIAKGHPSFEVLVKARQKIMELAHAPSG